MTQANKRITVCNNDTDKNARQSKWQKTDENRNAAHFGQSLDKLRKSISQLPSGRHTTVQLTNISPQTAQHCETMAATPLCAGHENWKGLKDKAK